MAALRLGRLDLRGQVPGFGNANASNGFLKVVSITGDVTSAAMQQLQATVMSY